MSITSSSLSFRDQSPQNSQKSCSFQIRPAKWGDIPFLGDLWVYQRYHHLQWDKLYRTTASGLEEWKKYIQLCLEQSNHLILVAEDDLEKIVGYIHGSYYPWPFSPYEVYGSLNTLVINPEVKRRGIGKKLAKLLHIWFKKEGIRHISVHVDYHNTAALALYKKMGFRSYQERLICEIELTK